MGNRPVNKTKKSIGAARLSNAVLASLASDTSPLVDERKREETVAQMMEAANTPKVTGVYFYFDQDNDFTVVLRGGEKPGRRYVICIILNDNKDINYRESQAMQAALKLSERLTRLTEADVKDWAKMMEKFGVVQLVDDTKQNALIMNVKPNPTSNSAQYLPGIVQRSGMQFDNDGNVVVFFQTDVEPFLFLIPIVKMNSSFADMQVQATADALSVAEQGDKMDKQMFLQYCARLRRKYNLLEVAQIQDENLSGLLVATIYPTRISPEEAGFPVNSEISLPAIVEGNDWSDATKERVIHILASNPELFALLAGSHSPHEANTASTQALTTSTDTSSGSSDGLPVFGSGRVATQELLKSSGQANVYRGVLQDFRSGEEKIVAVKVFHNTEDWLCCQKELMSLIRISGHPNVMEVLEFYEVPKPCFVMRFVQGGDLRDYLDNNGPFRSREANDILRGIGAGLKHLHDHHLVHRDLKSPNILLEAKGSSLTPVLIDLGIGRRFDDEASFAMTSAMKGTVFWTAPEMITDNKWSVKTDMYALGIIVWEMLTGKRPYENVHGLFQLITFVVSQEGRPDETYLDNAGVTAAQKKLIRDLWATDPATRPTADEFLHRLKRDFSSTLDSTTHDSTTHDSTTHDITTHEPGNTDDAEELSELISELRNLFVRNVRSP